MDINYIAVANLDAVEKMFPLPQYIAGYEKAMCFIYIKVMM